MKRSVFNQKGGVGKTSITCNIAAAMAESGKKTLVVDLDAQANSTKYLLGDDKDKISKTVLKPCPKKCLFRNRRPFFPFNSMPIHQSQSQHK